MSTYLILFLLVTQIISLVYNIIIAFILSIFKNQQSKAIKINTEIYFSCYGACPQSDFFLIRYRWLTNLSIVHSTPHSHTTFSFLPSMNRKSSHDLTLLKEQYPTTTSTNALANYVLIHVYSDSNNRKRIILPPYELLFTTSLFSKHFNRPCMHLFDLKGHPRRAISSFAFETIKNFPFYFVYTSSLYLCCMCAFLRTWPAPTRLS